MVSKTKNLNVKLIIFINLKVLKFYSLKRIQQQVVEQD